MRPAVSQFHSVESRERHAAAYQHALGLLPGDFEAHDAETAHGSIRMYCGGPRTAPPLLLLGGQDSPGFTWFKALPALIRAYRVLVAEPLGEVGASQQRLPISDAQQSSDCLAQAIAEIEPAGRPLRIAASGASARPALALARRAVRRVSGLLLLDPWGFGAEAPRTGARRLAAGLLAMLPMPVRSRAAERPGFEQLAIPELAGYARAILPFQRALPAVEPIGFNDFSAPEPAIRLLISDRKLRQPQRQWLIELSRQHPSVRWESIPENAESLALSRPDLLSAALLRR